jgi:hypothetical protein
MIGMLLQDVFWLYANELIATMIETLSAMPLLRCGLATILMRVPKLYI